MEKCVTSYKKDLIDLQNVKKTQSSDTFVTLGCSLSMYSRIKNIYLSTIFSCAIYRFGRTRGENFHKAFTVIEILNLNM